MKLFEVRSVECFLQTLGKGKHSVMVSLRTAGLGPPWAQGLDLRPACIWVLTQKVLRACVGNE